MIPFVLLALLFATIIYKALVEPLQYWKKLSIPYAPGWPIFGSMWKSMLGKRAMAHIHQDYYNKFYNHRYFGFYFFNSPSLFIRDAELAKQIFTKNFESFSDHRVFLPESADPFWNKVLFARKGKDWNNFRKMVSPMFSQSKMKHMFSFITECLERLIKNFPEDRTTVVEMGDVINKFTTDFTINCIFGLECDSYKNPENDFYQTSRKSFTLTTLKSLKFFGASLSPTLATMFKITLFDEPSKYFFKNVIDNTLRYREKHGIIRNDLLHLLKEAQRGRLKYESEDRKADIEFSVPKEIIEDCTGSSEISDDDIMVQILGFVLTNFDTVTTLISNMVYELAINPDIQNRLINEIDETWEKYDGNITYEHLLNMKYLDMVTSESLRHRSPTIFIDRVVTKPFIIEPILPHEKPLFLKPGNEIIIPVYCYLHDPQYFPNPEQFDPERFNDDNKHKILPHTYLSFGIGPRSCMGSRLVLLQTKAVVVYILRKFKLIPQKETVIPFAMSKMRISQHSESGYWFGLQPRW
ncbi:hypothetical protein FQA39_LY11108 [Lamprigera yunnana]|nr:hypothetical protein FQA39_LY11108 [Lamprigera yunnana]